MTPSSAQVVQITTPPDKEEKFYSSPITVAEDAPQQQIPFWYHKKVGQPYEGIV